jgi:hypothetical protein
MESPLGTDDRGGQEARAGDERVLPQGGALDAPAVPFLDRRTNARPRIESVFVRVVATAGIVGISVAVAALLWSSRTP